MLEIGFLRYTITLSIFLLLSHLFLTCCFPPVVSECHRASYFTTYQPFHHGGDGRRKEGGPYVLLKAKLSHPLIYASIIFLSFFYLSIH